MGGCLGGWVGGWVFWGKGGGGGVLGDRQMGVIKSG